MPPPHHLLLTDPGLEELVADEVQEAHPAARCTVMPYGVGGQLRVAGVDTADLLSLSTIHHVIELRGEGQARNLDDVRRLVAASSFTELDDARSFRVTTTRVGQHDFNSNAIAGATGAVLGARHPAPVDLEHYEINVRADLFDDRLVLGIQRTQRSLGLRIRRARSLRTGLKPTIAAAMLRLAGVHRRGGRLLDPLCGVGTIPIEALRLNPALEVHASDWDAATVEAARATLASHGHELPLQVADARQLKALHGEPFDFIVTDPPYGVRQARKIHLPVFYGPLLRSFEDVLADDGRVVLIVLRAGALRDGLRRTRLRIARELIVEIGGLHPRIYVLEHR